MTAWIPMKEARSIVRRRLGRPVPDKQIIAMGNRGNFQIRAKRGPGPGTVTHEVDSGSLNLWLSEKPPRRRTTMTDLWLTMKEARMIARERLGRSVKNPELVLASYEGKFKLRTVGNFTHPNLARRQYEVEARSFTRWIDHKLTGGPTP